MNRKVVLPFLVVAAGALAMLVLSRARSTPEREQPEPLPPLVRVVEVMPRDVRLDVASSGEVVPRTETALVAEVGGRVIEVSPSLAAGGFFREGEVLARIDPRDFRVAVTRAQARIAQEEVRLAREEGEAEIARRDWERLGGEGEPDPLVLREPQLAEARAGLASAQAELEKAELDLERTTIRAPYDGRVRAKRIDVGQFVAPGTPVAEVFADDVAEVRLAVPTDEIVWLDLPLNDRTGENGPQVVLRASVGGRRYEWTGRIVRVEGEIDRRTRMFHVVARVQDPYRRGKGAQGAALPVGLYVEASIGGRLEEGVFVLPRSAIRRGSQVLVVEGESLRIRDVEIVRIFGDEAVVRGLSDGELVCLSDLELTVDGMRVRVEHTDAESLAGSRAAASEGSPPAESAAGTPPSPGTAPEGTR
jgi:RND family efflux transporter MFP subunit